MGQFLFQRDWLDLTTVHFDPNTVPSAGLWERMVKPFVLQQGLWNKAEPDSS